MFINRRRIVTRTVLSVSIISLFSFFSINVNAITCVGVERCPANIKKLNKFARYGSPNAKIVLATLYADGRIVEKDLKKAFQLLRKAAWHRPSIKLGDHQLGVAYLKGLGTEKDITKARRNNTKNIIRHEGIHGRLARRTTSKIAIGH